MALRVLLADESSTIKKVFQLALQDYGVEVKPVNIGVDVVPIAKNFNPDIVFADVLLQKKSGYEVSSELKSDPNLSGIPVVLMWSGFMELDEDKYQASQANGKLEKPFDVTTLRKLVSELVPKTQSQRLSQYLSFPKLPELEEQQQQAPAAVAKPAAAPAQPTEEFKQMPIAKNKGSADRFRIPVNTDVDPEIPVSLKLSSDPIDVDTIFREADEPEEFQVRESRTTTQIKKSAPTPTSAPATVAPVQQAAPAPEPARVPQLTEKQIEEMIRAQAKEVIESVVWKILPELAQQIIEREIQKLLKEKDGSFSIDDRIRLAFEEDLPNGDLTTDSLFKESKLGRARLVAKEDLVLSQRHIFEKAIRYQCPEAVLKWEFKDGDFALDKQTLCVIQGDLVKILKAERVALNFLGHLCGIATLTRCFVQQVKETKCRILDTRKTTPMYRDLEKLAVLHGGGTNHRMNLSDAVLIKENHIRAAGGIGSAIKKMREETTAQIEIECSTIDEVRESVKLRVHRILLDNMSNDRLTEAVALIPATIQTEASGNMRLDRVKSVAELGVDYISVGALTHSAPSADISLLFEW